MWIVVGCSKFVFDRERSVETADRCLYFPTVDRGRGKSALAGLILLAAGKVWAVAVRLYELISFS